MKRAMSLLLSIVMMASVLSGISLTAYAENGECGENLTWSLDKETYELVISGTGDMYYYDDYTAIPWYSYRSSINSVVIESGVTWITPKAFYRCSSLTSAEIGSGVTEIPTDVFSGCSSLTGVTIPDSVTEIGYSAFYSCYNLTSVTIPDSVTTIGMYAFAQCNRLTSVIIPDRVTTLGVGAFNNCSSLTSVTIPSSVTTIGGRLFDWSNSLMSINVDSANTVYSSQDGVLYNKAKTTLMECPIGKSGAFTIPNSVVAIESWAFYACGSLTSVTIPNSVTTIGDYAFSFCYDLTIYGYSGTCAEQYAKDYSMSFISLGGAHVHNYTTRVTAPTCTTKGYTTYSCSCGDSYKGNETATKAHTSKTTTTKAKTGTDGSIVKKCTVCNKTLSTTVIPKASSINLSATSYTHDGKVKTPTVTVKDSKGKTLKNGTDYTVSNPSGRKNVGKYTVTITLKGNYSGKVTKTFTIKPKSTSISKLTATSKGFKVTWKKQATQTTGYQIQYSTSNKFSNAKTVTISKNGTTSRTVSKLTGKKKYFVRVRTYRTVSGTKIYSSWSGSKSVTTKK